jgi:hypothetical protein
MKNGSSISQAGQSLLETVLVLPPLLILLAGGYWFYRDLSLFSSAESAAHTEMLRAGRGQEGIEAPLRKMIHPENDVSHIEARTDPLIGAVPLFQGLSGRTIASAEVSLRKEPVGAYLTLPSHAIQRTMEGAVDCWGSETPSGRTVRRTVKGILAAAVLE